MAKAFDYLIEPFLTQYYFLESLLGDFLSERELSKMYNELARIFCITDEDELKKYYEESNSEHFKAIKNLNMYDKFCRLVEYAQITDQKNDITDSDKTILALKREAMKMKGEIFDRVTNQTKEAVTSMIETKASNGNVDAIAAFAYMEYNGLCVYKDKRNALKRVNVAARWNNLFGNLMGIAYDMDNKERYYNTMFTMLSGKGRERSFAHICSTKKCSVNCELNPVAKIISRAFDMDIIKRNHYDREFAKIAFSKIVSIEDKRKILLSKDENIAVTANSIPFDADTNGNLSFDCSVAEKLPLKREGEINRIIQNFTVASDCENDVYMPLLIISNDEFITSMYMDMIISGLGDTPLICLDGGTLIPQDFYGSKENVFLRGVGETKQTRTVFLIKDCEEFDEACTNEMLKLLDIQHKRKFKLFSPTVCIDISEIMFVLMAGHSSDSAARLSEWCETVRTEKVRNCEKPQMIDYAFENRSSLYGCTDLKLEDGCVQFLSSLDSKSIIQCLDGAIRKTVCNNARTVSVDDLKCVCEEMNIIKSRKEFGYMGGAKHDKN